MTNIIEWNAPFKINTTDKIDDVYKLTLKGVLIDTTENLNQWSVEAEDFEALAKDFVGKQIRSDHTDRLEYILGRVTGTEIDEPHAEAKAEWDPATPFHHLHFTGEMSSKNNEVIVPIQMGYVTHISPAVDARTILCATCKTPMTDKNTKACSCEEGGILLKDLSARELSIVCSPAYAGTVFKPYSFAASVDRSINNLKGDINMAEDARIVRLEASVAALINAFKAAQEEAEEELKAEEELRAEEELKAEEEEEKFKVQGEEEEEEKMVPVSKVAEEEEEEEGEEEEEEKKEDKVEKLEAAVRQLASLMKASKITPETPEDEPANTTHKVPKIANEPVKSEKLKSGFKFPLETGGMKPGKIKASAGRNSSGFTGSTSRAKVDTEQVAVDEIFGFAASRGTVPINADTRIRTIRYK